MQTAPSPSPEARLVARERVVTGVAVVLALPVLADVYGGWCTGVAARLEHAAVQLLVGPAVQLDRLGGLEHDPVLLQIEALAVAAGAGLLWRATSERPRARLAMRWVLGLPALAAVAAVAGVGAGLAPGMFVIAACFTVVGAVLGGRGAVRGAGPGPGRGAERGAGRWIALVGGALVLANGATMLASGPGDAPTPLGLAQLLGRTGLHATPLAAGAAGIVVATVAGLAAGWFGGRPIPRLGTDPLETARRGVVVAAAGLVALGYTAVTGFLGCDDVRAHEAVESLLDASGSFAVEAVPGPPEDAAFVAFREQGVVARIGLRTRSSTFLAVRDLPLDAYDGQVEEEGTRFGFPEELGTRPGGPVHAFVEVPRAEATTALLLLDPATGDVVRTWERSGACFVSSWAWDAGRGLGVAGCEWWGDVMEHDPEAGRVLERRTIDGAGEMEELLVAPDGSWLAVSLWTSPDLVRIDPDAGRVVDRRYVGGFNWALAPSTSWDRLYLGRFHARGILELDAATLAPIRTHRVGYGVRALAVDDRHGRLLAASTYDGRLYAVDPDGDEETERLRLGGWVRDIALAEGGRSLIAGGICGVLRVDLDAWLGAP